MIVSSNILVPTDFSPCAERALNYALRLSQLQGAKLHLLHVVTPIESDPYGPIHHLPEVDATHEGVEQLVHDLLVSSAEEQGTDEFTVEPVEVHAMKPAPGILDYADEIEVDLIVMGTHGRRGIRHFLMGSVAEECVRMARCSVLTIRQCDRPPQQDLKIRRMLVPVDFSDYTAPLLNQAIEIAKPDGAQIDLLYVIEPLPFPAAFSGMLSLREYMPHIRKSARKHLRALAKSHSQTGIQLIPHIAEGDPALNIIEFAESNGNDLIVVATEGRTGPGRFLIGGVTERVVQAAPCPVYVMKRGSLEVSGEAAA